MGSRDVDETFRPPEITKRGQRFHPDFPFPKDAQRTPFPPSLTIFPIVVCLLGNMVGGNGVLWREKTEDNQPTTIKDEFSLSWLVVFCLLSPYLFPKHNIPSQTIKI